MIEIVLNTALKTYNETIPVYGFKVPSRESGNAICYKRITGKTEKAYFDGDSKIKASLFHVTIRYMDYNIIVNDSGFKHLLNNIVDPVVILSSIEEYTDFWDEETQWYERTYKLIIKHKEEV